MIDIAVLRAAGLNDEQIVNVWHAEMEIKRGNARERKRKSRENRRSVTNVTDVTPNVVTSVTRKRRLSQKTGWPDDFTLDEQNMAVAMAQGWAAARATSEFERFRDNAKANNRKYA